MNMNGQMFVQIEIKPYSKYCKQRWHIILFRAKIGIIFYTSKLLEDFLQNIRQSLLNCCSTRRKRQWLPSLLWFEHRGVGIKRRAVLFELPLFMIMLKSYCIANALVIFVLISRARSI